MGNAHSNPRKDPDGSLVRSLRRHPSPASKGFYCGQLSALRVNNGFDFFSPLAVAKYMNKPSE